MSGHAARINIKLFHVNNIYYVQIFNSIRFVNSYISCIEVQTTERPMSLLGHVMVQEPIYNQPPLRKFYQEGDKKEANSEKDKTTFRSEISLDLFELICIKQIDTKASKWHNQYYGMTPKPSSMELRKLISCSITSQILNDTQMRVLYSSTTAYIRGAQDVSKEHNDSTHLLDQISWVLLCTVAIRYCKLTDLFNLLNPYCSFHSDARG